MGPNGEPYSLMGRDVLPEEKVEVFEENGICEGEKIVPLNEAYNHKSDYRHSTHVIRISTAK